MQREVPIGGLHPIPTQMDSIHIQYIIEVAPQPQIYNQSL